MKRIYDSNRLTELLVKAGLIAAIAATMLLPASIKAHGAQFRPSMVMTAQRAETIPLPPIPNLNAVPWLTLERAPKGPQIDTLLSPVPVGLQFALRRPGRLPMWPDSLLAASNTPRNG